MLRHNYVKSLVLVFIWISICGVNAVLAENDTAFNSTDEQISVPVEGITIFKYSPAGFQTELPEGVTTTLSSDDQAQELIMFLTENSSVLSVDFIKSNKTLEEVLADQITLFETKKDYNLTSKQNITFGNLPAYKVIFSYTDEDLSETVNKEAIISVNNGLRYVLMSDLDAQENVVDLAQQLLSSFEYIPVQEDTISKMIKTKMKSLEEPDKGYRRYRHYTRTTYHYYSYSYSYTWHRTTRLRYYCWCW